MGCASSIFHRRAPKTANVLRGHEGSINAMCLSADGALLATASEDSTCRVWDTETFSLRAEMVGHSQYVNCIAMDHEYVVTCSADKTIRKWDIHTGKCLNVLTGHQSIVNRVLIHESQLFTTSFDKTARQWSLTTGECLQVYRGRTRGVSPLLLANLTLPDTRPERRKSRTKFDRRLSTSSQFSFVSHKSLLITGADDNTARAWTMSSATFEV